jgi:multidrug efflux pump subunit AcrA (membrane-fusion protein)
MRIRRIAVILGLLALAAWAGWFARARLGGPAPSPGLAPGARTATVTRGRVQQLVKARGIVKPAPQALVRLGFPMPKDVARRISRLTKIEGDQVRTGEVVAELDHADLQATLRDLKGQAEVFRRRLDALRALEPLDVRVAESLCAENKAQLDHCQRVCERLERLGPNSAASTLEWETALTNRDVALAKLATSQANLEQVRAKYRTETRCVEAQIAQADAAIENVQVQIDWSTLRSPLDGEVFVVQQRQGELTSNNPNVPVLTLLDRQQLQLHLYVDEVDSGRIKPGQAVTFRVDAHPGETLTGTIVRLLPQPILQENVVYYLAVVDVAAAQRGLLRPEMTALGQIRVAENQSALLLPLDAVRSGASGDCVLRLTSEGPVETPVRIGWKDEGQVEIREGLAEGDQVLVEP